MTGIGASVERADVAVIGAGAFGLATALAAARRGLDVVVVEAEAPGAGASGGTVGALTAHRPGGRWDPLKALQLEALIGWPGVAARLAEESGLDPGYRRHGRLTPLAGPEARAAAEADREAAAERWPEGAGLAILDAPPATLGEWVEAPHGLVHDTLAAQVDPPRLVAAMVRAADRTGVRVRMGTPARVGDEGEVMVGRSRVQARDVVVATGWRALGGAGIATPRAPGLKGQSALLEATAPDALPLLTRPGLYVVAHGPGRVGVGSTSEESWDHEGSDDALDLVIAKARALSPALRGAPVVRRWAGIRPRPPGRMPLAGPVPGRPGLWIATGGYKIGLALAPLVGEAMGGALAGDAPPPEALAPPAPG